jgi:hypothetical protein
MFIEPKKKHEKHEKKVEKIRMYPKEVHKGHRSKKKSEDGGKRKRRCVGKREIRIAHDQNEEEEDGVKDQKTITPEDLYEWRGEKGIDVGFCKEQPVIFPFFQEDPKRARIKGLVVTDQVLLCVFEVKVIRQALCHRIINGFIGKEKISLQGWKVYEER